MNTSSKHIMLQQKEILSTLTDDQLTNVANACHYEEVKKGSKIYKQGQRIQYVYLLEKGSIKLATTASCGKTLIKDIMYEDDLFGENVFSEQSTRLNYAEAAGPTGYFAIPVDLFRQIVITNTQFAQAVMDLIIQRLHALEERMQSFVFKKAKTRIFDFIKSVGQRKGIPIGLDECLINHGMSHRDIAYLTDTSRQTVARVMSELKRDNLIHFSARKPGKILIRNFGM
jgi:CRP-like cAMP-binding protein